MTYSERWLGYLYDKSADQLEIHEVCEKAIVLLTEADAEISVVTDERDLVHEDLERTKDLLKKARNSLNKLGDFIFQPGCIMPDYQDRMLKEAAFIMHEIDKEISK